MRCFTSFILGLFGVIFLFPSCRKNVDNPPPDAQHGAITTLTLVISDSSAFPAYQDTIVFDDPDGAGGQQPIRWDTVRLQPERFYKAQVYLTNKLANPIQNLNPIIIAQGTQHLFVYRSDTSMLKVRITDQDNLNLPLGLQTSWETRKRIGWTNLEINLRHIAFGKNNNSGISTGHSDLQVLFPLSIQP